MMRRSPQNACSAGQALFRTRTGDPFLTMEGEAVHTGPLGSAHDPESAAQRADRSGHAGTAGDSRTADDGRALDALAAINPRRAAALRELIAMARGHRSDPNAHPTDPPLHCDVDSGRDDCDRPGVRWVWFEEAGGWIQACDQHSFECDSCEGVLLRPDGDAEAAEAEAAAAFTPSELTSRAVICDDCWRAMRAAMPDFDQRYDDDS